MSNSPEPAWVISQRPYGNTGRLVELFTAQRGRVGAIARGVHRRNSGGKSSQFLQLFYPLLVSFTGRGELKQLTHVEPAGLALRPVGRATLCGQYVNELILRLLPRFDPHPGLFAQYGNALEAIADGVLEPALRRFEVALLDELGYTVEWRFDAQQGPLLVDASYLYRPGVGFLQSDADAGISGSDLIAASQWLADTSVEPMPHTLAAIKRVCRQALSSLLGERPLRTREQARQLDWSTR